MEHVSIRQAKLDDLNTLYGFEQQVINAERPFDPTLQTGHINYYDIEHLITAPHIEIVVAEIAGKVIGCGYARIEDSKIYLKHPKHAYLGFMFVEAAYRGKGVNKLIIDTLEKWAISQNITELRLQVYADNLPAVKAYEKVGFLKLMLKMRKEIN
jgi:GNAT superfamily N-acetyltransferase